MTTAFLNEFDIDSKMKSQIINLLSVGFQNSNYPNRHFFKQLPHYRLLLIDEENVIGHVAIDYRVMNLNGELVFVLGIIDLVVHPDLQGRGLGTKLMIEFDQIASSRSDNIDFTFLVTDKPNFYSRLGYHATDITTTWLKLYQGKSYGIGHEKISDSVFMYKQIGGKTWTNGELDLLGYMY